MKREDLLNFNFDWHDEKTFKKALAESGLTEKEKIKLRDERMSRLELEDIKAYGSDYDDDDEEDAEEEAKEEAPAEKTEKAKKESGKKSDKAKKKSSDGKKEKKPKNGKDEGGIIVSIRQNYPFSTLCVSFLLSAFIMILPFISYMHIEELSMLTFRIFSANEGTITDWFLYQKEFCVVMCGIMLILFFITDRAFMEHDYKKLALAEKPLRLPLIMTGIYVVLLVLSCMFSENKELVMMGIVKQYEGMLGILGYIAIFLAGMNYFNNTKSLRIFTDAMMMLSLAAGIFALMEYGAYKGVTIFGHELTPLQGTEFMARLMAPKEYYETAKALKSASENVHITFYNSNYFGGFCGLMFPLTAAAALGQKNYIKKGIGLIASVLLIIAAIFSNSTGGLYTVAGGVVLLLIAYAVYWKKKLINRKVTLAVVVSALVLGIGALTVVMKNDDEFAKRFMAVVNNGTVVSKETREERQERFSKDCFVVDDINIEGDRLIFTDYKGNTVQLREFTDEDGDKAVLFYDGEGNELETYVDEYVFYFTDERFKNINFKFSDTDKVYCDLGYKSKLIFQYENETFKPYVHGMYTIDNVVKYSGPEFFKDKLRLGTGRGFIWGATLGMLKNCIVLGHGCGNFALYFPQYDSVSLIEVYNTPAMVINKPHNMYLGIAADSGVISMIAILILFGAFVIKGFKTCILHPVNDRLMHMRLGVYLSSIAYMMVGMVNDSYVCVSPVFWFIFGIAWYSISGCEVVETDE